MKLSVCRREATGVGMDRGRAGRAAALPRDREGVVATGTVAAW
ncbi:hypothetical protein AB0K14_27680 [Actinosynnema sp. NPDC050801]